MLFYLKPLATSFYTGKGLSKTFDYQQHSKKNMFSYVISNQPKPPSKNIALDKQKELGF